MFGRLITRSGLIYLGDGTFKNIGFGGDSWGSTSYTTISDSSGVFLSKNDIYSSNYTTKFRGNSLRCQANYP